MMKPGLSLAIVALALLAPGGPAPAADRTAFVAGVEDLPLAPGMKVVSDTVVAFDAAAGRIVEAYAVGPLTKRFVLDFYGQTLPFGPVDSYLPGNVRFLTIAQALADYVANIGEVLG